MEEPPFIWKLFMQDDQKDPLPICANDTIKVPLWLNTAAFPGFSLKVIKLEKTIYIQMLKTNLSHWFWNVPVCQDLVLLWPYMVTERQKSDSACTLAAWANVSPKRKKVGQFTFNWTCMNVTESVRADKRKTAHSLPEGWRTDLCQSENMAVYHCVQ